MAHDKILSLTALSACTALLLVAGCGKSEDAARQEREASQRVRAEIATTADAQAAANQANDMVAAVTSATSATPVSLKFRLPDRPQVGQPLHLQLALAQAPGLEIDSIHIALQAREGLKLESDAALDFVKPPSGATQNLQVLLLPLHAGVLGLHVTVLVDTANFSIARSFSVPLIAADAAQ